MKVLSGSSKIADLILEDLCTHPASSAKSILTRLEGKGVGSSRQSIHRTLGIMKDNGIIVHQGQKYSVKISWIVWAQNLLNRAAESYFSNEALRQIEPDVGESKEWRFSNLLEMDSFGCHIDLYLMQAVKDRRYFAWEPFPWYVAAVPEQEQQFSNALHIMQRARYIVVGGHTALHKIRAENGRDMPYKILYDCDFYKDRSYFEYLYGDFILETHIPDKTTRKLEKFFQDQEPDKGIDLAELRKIAKSDTGGVVLRLSRNKEVASEKRSRYVALFQQNNVISGNRE